MEQKSKVSFHCGKKLSREHNIRDFDSSKWNTDGHIKEERTNLNLTLNDNLGSWHQWCENTFGTAIDEFNEKNRVKHPDRVIDKKTYYKDVRKKVQESIIQVGNGEYNPITEGEHINFLMDVMEHWERDNPSLKIVGAYIHMDETTPHLHLDWVPVAHSTRGQTVKVSMDGALKELGFARKKEHKFEDTPYKNWIVAERTKLEEIGRKYCSVEEADHTHQKHHQETYEYKAKNAQAKVKKAEKEVVEAEKQVAEAKTKLDEIVSIQILRESSVSRAKRELEKVETKVKSLTNEVESLSDNCETLEEKKSTLTEEIDNLQAVGSRIERMISNKRQELDQIRDEGEFEQAVARIMATSDMPRLPRISVYEQREAKKTITGKEATPALTSIPTEQFTRFVNTAFALEAACDDAYHIKKVAQSANLKVTQQALYKAQEDTIRDLKEENSELRKWKIHTSDYDELEKKVTKLEKTINVLKSVATKMFSFIKRFVYQKGDDEVSGLDAFKEEFDIIDDSEEEEVFEDIEYEAKWKNGMWFS